MTTDTQEMTKRFLDLGYDEEFIANLCNVTQSAVQKWRDGRNHMNNQNRQKLVAFLIGRSVGTSPAEEPEPETEPETQPTLNFEKEILAHYEVPTITVDEPDTMYLIDAGDNADKLEKLLTFGGFKWINL